MIREEMEAQQRRHQPDSDWAMTTGTKVCLHCHLLWPCSDYQSAEDVIVELDAAERLAIKCAAKWEPTEDDRQFIIKPGPYVPSEYRLVRDPVEES